MLTLIVIVLLSTDPEGDYLKIRLTAADALVLEKTITQEFLLYAAEIRFATQPISLQLLVNGQEF